MVVSPFHALINDSKPINDVIPKQVIQEALDEPQLKRSTRPRQVSTKYSPYEYVLVTNKREPKCFYKAMLHKKRNEWFKAM